MRKRLIVLLCIGITACSVKKSAKNDVILSLTNVLSEEQRIKNCFSGYKSAIQNDKSVEAVEYDDSRTINYYQEIPDNVKNADSTEVNEMNIMDRMMVFSIRHQMPKKDILQFDGKQLMVYTIQIGMVGVNSFNRIEIGEIEIDEKFAKGQAVINGKPEPIYFHFYKEQEKWRIDLISTHSTANKAFKQMVVESGQDENEYLFTFLEMTTGGKPKSEIWQTIKE